MNNKHIIYKSACSFLGNKFSFNSKKLRSYKLQANWGFSLIELTVAVAIFSIIIVSAGNIFIQIFKTQKEMISKQILIDEGRYIMESLIKDIRMGYKFTSTEENTRLDFTRYNGDAGLYCLADGTGACNQGETYLAKTNNQIISSEKVNIKNLEFYIDKTGL